MGYVGTYDRTIFYNPSNKYCIISVKTSDQSVPQQARSAYRHRDNMIRFIAVGYELPQTDMLHCEETASDTGRLTHIAELFGDALPKDYRGRSVAPSDVIELYDDTGRRYFYRDTDGFCPVKFSPMLAKK